MNITFSHGRFHGFPGAICSLPLLRPARPQANGLRKAGSGAYFRRAVTILACLAGIGSLRAEEAPSERAHFLTGSHASALDEFPGGPGNGWLSEWKVLFPSVYQDRFSLEIKEADPFPETPGRLEVRGKDEEKQILLSRTLDPSVIDSSKPYTVVLKARMDSGGPAGEPFGFTFSSLQEGADWGPSGSLWYISIQNDRWTVVGANQNENGLTWHRLPIPVEAGVVYTFRVNVFPATGTFRADLSNGSDHAESPEMHSASKTDPNGGKIELRVRASRGDTTTSFSFSLAGLEVRPEK